MTVIPPVPPPPDDGFDTFAALLDAVHAYITNYVVLTKHQAIAVTLWVAHTWVYLQFDATPRLHISSPEAESGKSRLCEVLDAVVAEPLRASSATPASLFRGIEALHPTMMLDEADNFLKGADKGDRADVIGIINDGYRADGAVLRVVGEGKKMRAQRFSVFAPLVIAGLSRTRLPDTTMSRTIPIDMRRKKAGEHAARFRLRDSRAAAKPLRDGLGVWSGSDPAKELGDARPELPDELSDRQQDIWEPLLAIADVAAGDWPQVARVAAVHLHTKSLTATRGASRSLGVKLLGDIRRVWLGKWPRQKRVATADLLDGLNSLEDAPWATLGDEDEPLKARRLALLLGDYGIKPKALSIDGYSDGTRGYELEWFTDAWDRYVTDGDDTEPASAVDSREAPPNPQDPQESPRQAVSDDSQPARQDESLRVEYPPKPRGEANLAGLAGQNGHPETTGTCVAQGCNSQSRVSDMSATRTARTHLARVPMTVDYRTRVTGIRFALGELHHEQQQHELPDHLVDQLAAANHHAFTSLRRLGAAERQLDPDRWKRPHETSDDLERVIDVQAHVLAAMGDGQRWPVCIHLRSSPAQTAYVLLPVRRIDCHRCVGTFRQPPADEHDRCDLCGARGITEFWPLRVAVAYWIVLGDTCQPCARELGNPAAA